MSSKQSYNFVLLVALICATVTAQVFASSCCAGGGGQSVCVLPAEQKYQLGLSNTYRSIQGEFDPYGHYSSNPNGNSSQQIISVLGGAYRLNNEDWQLGLSIPFTRTEQSNSNSSHQSTAMGDPAVEGRYLFWDDLAFLRFRPQLAFYSGARFPLGTSVYNTTDPYALDAVGDGTTTLHLGAAASKLYRPVKISLDGTIFYPFKKTVNKMHNQSVANPYQLKMGNRFQLAETMAYLFNERWSSSLGSKQLWVLQSSIDGNAVNGSAQRLFTTLASVNYSYDNSWAVGLSYETAFPFYRFQANEAYAQSVGMAITYGGI